MNKNTKWLKRWYRRRPEKWSRQSLRWCMRALASKSDRGAQAWCKMKGLDWW